MLSCLWDDAYKRTFAANRKEGFLSRFLSGPLLGILVTTYISAVSNPLFLSSNFHSMVHGPLWKLINRLIMVKDNGKDFLLVLSIKLTLNRIK